MDRAQGNRDEARTQFDLARKIAAGTPAAPQATFRLARTNFELREFRQAQSDLASLGSGALPSGLSAAVLGLQGETAYQVGDYAAAGAAFRRALLEAPNAPESPMVRLAVAWTSLRQGRADVARQEFLAFARSVPDHASAADALELAAEVALTAGDYAGARELLDRIVQTYPTHPRAGSTARSCSCAPATRRAPARSSPSGWPASRFPRSPAAFTLRSPRPSSAPVTSRGRRRS